MTLEEAAAQGMTGCAMIVWSYEGEMTRRTSLFHVEVRSGRKTVCGRRTENWAYVTISFPALHRRVRDRDNLCSECRRLVAEYDFSPGKEPSRSGGLIPKHNSPQNRVESVLGAFCCLAGHGSQLPA